jgi:hypothetical protein
MVADPDDLERQLVKQLEKAHGPRGETLVAWCLGERG